MAITRYFGPLMLLLAWDVSASGQFEYTHDYPFTTCKAVVSEQTGSNPAKIFEGAGAGVFALQATNAQPSEVTSVASQLRFGGTVRDLALTDSHLYAAAHREGLVRVNRSSSSGQAEWTTATLAIDVSDAWAVEVPARVGGIDLVFVGTNDDYYIDDIASGGTVHLMWADAATSEPDPPELKASLPLGAPIFSLASMVHDNTVTLLVGTGCRQPTTANYESLLRFDFDITTGLPQVFPNQGVPSAVWNPTVSGSTVATFIRDIVIDPDEPAAYVAAYTRGVFKVSMAGGGLSDASGPWPIAASSSPLSYSRSLALHDGSLGKILVVGFGPSFGSEHTDFGPCSVLCPCDSSCVTPTQEPRLGISLYDLESSTLNSVGSLTSAVVAPVALSTYVWSGSLIIAAAANQHGRKLIKATPASGSFTLTEVGAWNVADEIPTGQFDDLMVLKHNVFVAAENSLVAFDSTEVNGAPASELFAEPVDVDPGGGVILAGCPSTSTYPTLVFGSAQTNGIVLFEVLNDGPDAEIHNHGSKVATTRGKTARTYSVAAIPSTETPDGYPWVIAINTLDSATAGHSCSDLNGSVRVYRVDLDSAGLSDESLIELGAYAPTACSSTVTGSLFGGFGVADQDGATIVVGYSPQSNEPNAGLLFLRFDFQANGAGKADDALTLASSVKVPAFTNAQESNSGLVFYKISHGYVAAAFGCNGVATFSMSQVLVDKWSPPAGSSVTFLDCATADDGNAYFTGLNGQLWVFDPQAMSGGPIAKFDTQEQAACIVSAPSTESGSPQPPAFFLTDFQAGLHRIQFLTVPD